MKLLITGGAGYIGSHAVLKAINEGYQIFVIDNLLTTDMRNLESIRKITKQNINFYKQNLLDKKSLDILIDEINPDFVIHFAALKSVSESQSNPELYLTNNVEGTKNLIDSLKEFAPNLRSFVFSSTAAVYGDITNPPIDENYPTNPISAYGESKLRSENYLLNMFTQNPTFSIIIFRYFNVIGNQKEGLIGEFPDKCTNLLPIILNVASKNRESFDLFGLSFDTKDGSQERDYIDVNDLIDAHFLAINYQKTSPKPEALILNLSTNKTTSCLEMHALCEKITGLKIPYNVKAPREGDPIRVYSTNILAIQKLGWNPTTTVKESIESQWKWFEKLKIKQGI